MKKIPTKSEIRCELEQQIEEYLAQGGSVESVPRGTSGRDPSTAPPEAFSTKPKESRTPVPEVVAAIESRKRPTKPAPKPKRRAKKKLIYDDFGEPLRWEWVEE